MKKILLFLGLSLSMAISAQDRIITKKGEVIQAYRIDMGGNAVYYKLEDSDTASLQSIEKGNVVMISKQDGTVINLYDKDSGISAPGKSNMQETQNMSEPTIPVMLSIADLTKEEQDANTVLLQEYSKDLSTTDITTDNAGKKANGIWGIFGINSNSIISNKDIEISIISGVIGNKDKNNVTKFIPSEELDSYVNLSNAALTISIRNKQNRTIYLDLGNTFYVSMGESQCYYIPTSTTTTSSNSGGAAVNLGAVTGALGIGGAVGTLASGVNVGGGNTHGTINTTYAQRIIALAPMGSVNLDAQFLFGNTVKKICNGLSLVVKGIDSYHKYLNFNFSKKSPNGELKIGEHLKYNENSSPVNLSFVISYSYAENCTNMKSIQTNLFLKDIIGIKIRWKDRISLTNCGILVNMESKKGLLQYDKTPFFIGEVDNHDGDSFPRPTK